MKQPTQKQKQVATEGQLLTLAEASVILHVSKPTLREWDNKGILKAVRFGERKDRRYRKEDIEKLAQQKQA